MFEFPPQEHKLRINTSPFDPATRKHAGEIVELDREARELELKRGPILDGRAAARGAHPRQPYRTEAQEAALMRFGRSLLAGDHRYPALESVLRRTPFDRTVQTNDLDELEALLLSLDGRHLVIQGPPGSGKTWTSARLIARLLSAGKRVGVASTSHKAIHKLLEEVEAAGISVEGVKKASAGNPESFYEGERIENVTDAADCGDAPLLGGTAWLFARDQLDRELDYLFIDESGQVSLADALAMGTAARNLVLVGDPLQLAQVLQGSHPRGADASVLKHLLGEHATTAAHRAAIEAVAMAMWEPYIGSTRAHLPGAEAKIVFDKFHIAQHANQAVDPVRRQEHRALQTEGHDWLVGTKYDWLRHPDASRSRPGGRSWASPRERSSRRDAPGP